MLTRTPLHRYTPLPRATKPMRRESPKHRVLQAAWNKITRGKIAAGMTCELRVPGICTVRGTEGAHMLAKSQGGTWTEDNHKLACRPCAHFATINPAWAAANGCAIRRSTFDPVDMPKGAEAC